MFEGEFVKGLRQGYGIFYYANGARYEGDWNENNKTGKVGNLYYLYVECILVDDDTAK